MHIAEIWRYPVKSMAGERLERAHIDSNGIAGDRILQVRTRGGRVITSRTHPRLLGHRATIDDNGQISIDGKPWTDPALATMIEEIAGSGSRLVREESPDRFDILPLLVATDGAITAFGHDGRRLRPNLVIGGVTGLEERSWEGSQLVVGDVRIGIHDLRGRCVMTTFDPDTLQQNSSVLREIVQRFGGKLALNCEVLQGGEIALNQKVEIIRR